jgi:DNA-binding NtrC family response regulator
MKYADPIILFFAERDYPFIRSTLDTGRAVRVDEPSELLEAIKRKAYSIIIFDSAHSQFAPPLVHRIYSRTPMSEYWLLADNPEQDFPNYLLDAVFPSSVKKSEFNNRVESVIGIKSLLDDYHMVGKSGNLKQVATMIAQVAPTDISTLIMGPSGSGKELVARALHENSSRKNKTYMAINCGALAESLLESELFGYEKGAFTGAAGRREGIFKRADEGTVFLDEIGETLPALQVRLLRVLEEGSFYRVGGGELVDTDVRIVAATNRELTEAISEGDFREDLYFRLGAVRINLLGLTERQSDIIPLINHFFIEETGSTRGISERAMDLLLNYGWPGNVRQLHNFVNRMIVASGSGEISEPMVMQFVEEQGYTHRNLPVVTGKMPQEAEFQLIYQALLSLGQEVRMLRELIVNNLPGGQETVETQNVTHAGTVKTVEDMEEELIKQTLASVGGNRRAAAKKLGIGERTLYRKLKKYGEI